MGILLGAYLLIKDKKIKTIKEIRICSLCKKDYTKLLEYDFCPKCGGEIEYQEVDHEGIKSGWQEINNHEEFVDKLIRLEYPRPKNGIYAFSNFTNCKSRIPLGDYDSDDYFVQEMGNIDLESTKVEFIKRFGKILQTLDVAGFEYELKTGHIHWYL